jgi:hypothetical protein
MEVTLDQMKEKVLSSTQRKALTCQWWCKDNFVDVGLA